MERDGIHTAALETLIVKNRGDFLDFFLDFLDRLIDPECHEITHANQRIEEMFKQTEALATDKAALVLGDNGIITWTTADLRDGRVVTWRLVRQPHTWILRKAEDIDAVVVETRAEHVDGSLATNYTKDDPRMTEQEKVDFVLDLTPMDILRLTNGMLVDFMDYLDRTPKLGDVAP